MEFSIPGHSSWQFIHELLEIPCTFEAFIVEAHTSVMAVRDSLQLAEAKTPASPDITQLLSSIVMEVFTSWQITTPFQAPSWKNGFCCWSIWYLGCKEAFKWGPVGPPLSSLEDLPLCYCLYNLLLKEATFHIWQEAELLKELQKFVSSGELHLYFRQKQNHHSKILFSFCQGMDVKIMVLILIGMSKSIESASYISKKWHSLDIGRIQAFYHFLKNSLLIKRGPTFSSV